MNCQVCGKFSKLDRCHIKAKGSGGPDAEWNIYLACRDCHMTQHRVGHRAMCQMYPQYKEILIQKGWSIEEVFGRFLLTHPQTLSES